MQSFQKMTNFFAVGSAAMLIAVGCAHKLEPVAMSPTSNPIQELQSLATDMDAARAKQFDVLAPRDFEKTEKYLTEAIGRRDRNEDGGRILESIGYARAYLNEAGKTAKVTDAELHESVVAREAALTAGARNSPQELGIADRRFARASNRIAEGKGVDLDTRNGIHQSYLDLELNAIKTAKLLEANNYLKVAEKKGAKRLIPNSYWTARQKIDLAEKVINTDRHDTAAVDKASMGATESAKHMVTILETALAAKGKNIESIALELDSKNNAIAQDRERLRRVATEALNKDKTLGQMQDQVEDLQAAARLDKLMKDARASFLKDEADVYRQDGSLLIRLKSMNFPIGKSDIPTDSLATLRKVKNIVGEAEINTVIVEGHTDAVGSASLNKKISEKRADTVAKYLVDEKAVPEDHIRAVGYGFERPIASNKSRDGRKQNRRVDIVIKTMGESAPTTQTE